MIKISHIENSLHIDKPLDEVVLIFEILRQLDMETAVECFKYDVDDFRCLLVESG